MDISSPLFPSQYREYMASPEWRVRKLRYWQANPKKCLACGSLELVELHHHTYERMGMERDADLVPLCKEHHALVHAHQRRTRRDLTIATFEVVRLVQGKGAVIRGKQPKPNFVPRNQRGAVRDAKGFMVSALDWRDEVRPWG